MTNPAPSPGASPGADPNPGTNSVPRAFKVLRWHGLVMFCLLGVLFTINWLYAGSGWFFWLAMAWGAVFMIHYLIVKSIYADEDWAYDRADELRLHSYDHRHMDAIRGHYIKPRARQQAQDKKSNNDS